MWLQTYLFPELPQYWEPNNTTPGIPCFDALVENSKSNCKPWHLGRLWMPSAYVSVVLPSIVDKVTRRGYLKTSQWLILCCLPFLPPPTHAIPAWEQGGCSGELSCTSPTSETHFTSSAGAGPSSVSNLAYFFKDATSTQKFLPVNEYSSNQASEGFWSQYQSTSGEDAGHWRS